MSKSWPVQDANSRLEEILDAALTEGPQVVTRHGVETAVVVPIDQWRRLKNSTGRRPKNNTGRNLKELLLAPEARTEQLTPPRRRHRHRPPPILD